jgi:hypothetical protein
MSPPSRISPLTGKRQLAGETGPRWWAENGITINSDKLNRDAVFALAAQSVVAF